MLHEPFFCSLCADFLPGMIGPTFLNSRTSFFSGWKREGNRHKGQEKKNFQTYFLMVSFSKIYDQSMTNKTVRLYEMQTNTGKEFFFLKKKEKKLSNLRFFKV